MENMKQPMEQEAPAKKWSKGKLAALVGGGLALLVIVGLILFFALRDKGEEPKLPPLPGEEQTEEADGSEAADPQTPPASTGTGDTQEEADSEQTESTDLSETRVDPDLVKQIASYSYLDETKAEEYNQQIVATIGEHELTNRLLQIFYWSQFYNVLNQNEDYLSYMGLDTTMSLSEQTYGEGTTWEQFLLQQTMDMYLQYCILNDEAKAKGLEPSEEDADKLSTLPEDLESAATGYGYESAEDYLQRLYGPGVTVEDYVEYYTLFAYAKACVTAMQSAITPSQTEVETYYDVNATAYEQQGVQKINRNVVDVRHILIQPELDIDTTPDDENLEMDGSSEEAWAAAEKSANEIYESWETNPTEDHFAQMATDCTYDTASAEAGGLYKGVYPGQMVTEFEAWSFDENRKPGDTGIIRTSYGYHIMYFVGEGDYMYWYAQAEYDCMQEHFDEQLDEVFATQTLKPYYENVHLFDVLVRNTKASAAADKEAETADPE